MSLRTGFQDAWRRHIKEELAEPRRVSRTRSLPEWLTTLRTYIPDSSSAQNSPDTRPASISREYSSRKPQSLNDLTPLHSFGDHPDIDTGANSDAGQSARWLCQICCGINYETIGNDGGYDHLLLYELRESKVTCHMCKFIYMEIGMKMDDCDYTPDRYRFRLSYSKDDEESSQLRNDHEVFSSFWSSERNFSSAWIDVMDLRPWEPPEYYKVRYRYMSSEHPEKYLEPRGSSPKSVRGTSISCFTEENDPARQLGMRWIRHIGEDTSTSSSLEVAKAWLKQCLSNSGFSSNYHRSVPHHSGSHMPTKLEADVDANSERPSRPFDDQNPHRLLKIKESTSGDLTVRVVDTQNKPYRYAALSYCWGKQKLSDGSEWFLATENNDLHHVNIVLQDLPPTIRDSISIAWSLGIEYLWIDALCIIQNSASDWAQEAAKMGGIYFGSVITIAVAGSPSALEGCFNSKSERSTELKEFEDLAIVKTHLADGSESCLYFLGRGASIPDMYQDEIVDGPLSKRAWTYQEYICPRRILYLTSKQLFWECTHCRLSEDNFPQVQSQRPYPILDFEYALDHKYIASLWYIDAIQQYSQRQLTFEGDKLIAISALARATHCNRPSDYVAGLWKDSLMLGLLWCRSGNGRKSTTFACPSWSWASQNSSVSYEVAAQALRDLDDDEENQRQEEYRVRHQGQDQDQEVPGLDIENRTYQEESLNVVKSQIVSVKWKPDPVNAFGNVLDASIDLNTILGTGIVLRDNFGKSTFAWHWEDTSSQAIMMPYISPSGRSEWWHGTAMMDDAGTAGGQVAIALIRDSQTRRPAFLLLEPPDLEAKTFRRVGLAQLDAQAFDRDKNWSSLVKNWVKRTIRLI